MLLFCQQVRMSHNFITPLAHNWNSLRNQLKGCQIDLDRKLARFIYVREVKRFDPFKFSIYAWCIKIAIAGILAPVRLAWVPFLRVPKNGFIYVEADTKKLYAGL